MRDYHINIFYSDEDTCYVADIPDLVSCSAFGETPEDALRELQIAKGPGSTSPANGVSPSRARGIAPLSISSAPKQPSPFVAPATDDQPAMISP